MTTTADPALVGRTAFSPAYLRSGSGIPYADEIAALTGACQAVAAKLVGGEEDLPIMRDRFSAWAELRFRSLSAAVRERLNVMELAAGFSPRGLIFTEDPDALYLSTDLEVVQKGCRAVMRQVAGTAVRSNLWYQVVDVLNTDDVVSCAQIFLQVSRAPIAVVNEGLLAYFNREQKFQAALNICALLKITGGTWYTTDIHTLDEMARTAALGQEYMKKFEGNVGWRFEDGCFDSLDEAQTLMEEAGFNVERRDQLDFVPNLTLTICDGKVRQMLADQHLWMMTPR